MNAQASKLRVLALQTPLARLSRLLGKADAPAVSRRHARRLSELPRSILDGNARMTRWSDPKAYAIDLPQELANGWAMPSARAGRASHRALLHGLGHTAPIAIAAFALLYFGGELLRAVLS